MLRLLFAAFLLLAIAPLRALEPPSRHVLLVVWDGMRPDFINAENTPHLHALAARGVFFEKHHPAYPSSTEVNGTALATGLHPARSGVMANREFRPQVDPANAFATEDRNAFAKFDAATGGKYLTVATVAELVQRSGQRTAIAGTKGVNVLHDRGAGAGAATKPPSVNVFTEWGGIQPGTVIGTVPPGALADLVAARGPIPSKVSYPNTEQDHYTTRTLIDHLWSEGVPIFSTLWLSEPDYTQHQAGPGSPEALAAIRSSDTQLGFAIDALRERKLLERTDILVVSDHGFSLIERPVDTANELRTNGFVARREWREPRTAGQILVVGLGGSVALYVEGREEKVMQDLIAFLQTQDWCGPIFSRLPAEGVFALSDVRIDTPTAPDIVFSMRWNGAMTDRGFPGSLITDGTRRRGTGTHASLSRYDQRNTLVAAGPSFQRGKRSQIPSGNIDVAPTILHLLGLKSPEQRDGRVLLEALENVDLVAQPQPKTERKEATRKTARGTWKQYLQTTTVNGSVYLDEGNAEIVP
ncbi:MAG: alkaline phosphatase family protein [Verrucomicrobia bacterium]|nr:alkaline phosphatase family protein [Verrucomicrobiota bacterium]